jgi:23S rRNA (adenine2503-C2)-methyltransferase
MPQPQKGEALVGMDLADLEKLLGSEHPSFRARQLFDAVYRKRLDNLSDATNLPQGFRLQLVANYPVGLPELEHCYDSSDGTRRYLLRLRDNRTIEAVLMPETARDTICISSQVGCPVDCRFCLTALMGLERNLTAGEIVGQVLYVTRENSFKPERTPINIVMMGMGEPLLNLSNVLKATRLLTHRNGLAIPERRITVSTSGFIPQMEELGQASVRPKLAVSLNASTEEQRRELMPITRKYHLADLIAACKAYPLRPWEKLTFEYVLLRNVNDTDADARRVIRLISGLNCKVNLIALNPGPGIPFATPDESRVHSFQRIIRRAVPCFIRKPRGRDIFAACGQLKRVSSDLVEIT